MRRLVLTLFILFGLLFLGAAVVTWLLTNNHSGADLLHWATSLQQHATTLPQRQPSPTHPGWLLLYGGGLVIGLGLFYGVLKELHKRLLPDKENPS